MKVTVNTEKENINLPLSVTPKESKLPAVSIKIFLPSYLQTERKQISNWVRFFCFYLFESFSV